jgi:hypothetical protein
MEILSLVPCKEQYSEEDDFFELGNYHRHISYRLHSCLEDIGAIQQDIQEFVATSNQGTLFHCNVPNCGSTGFPTIAQVCELVRF